MTKTTFDGEVGVESFLNDISHVWRPHAGQRAFLLAKQKLRVLACGRRWGKTEVCAAEIVHAILRGPPTKHFLVAPTLDQAKILFDRVCDFLSRFSAVAGHELGKLRPRLSPYPKLEIDGHSVVARSGHNPRSLRGNEATHIVVDEAAFLPAKTIDDVLWPMLATTNGTMTLISTPNGHNAFWRYYEFGASGKEDAWSRQSPSSENPAIRPDFLGLQREILTERAYQVEYGAEFLDTEGQVFREEAIAECLVTEFADEPRGPFRIGIDWAQARDFSTLVVLSGTFKGARLVETLRVGRLPWPTIGEMFMQTVRKYPDSVVVCDTTGVGKAQTEWVSQASGIRLSPFVFTATSKGDLIGQLVKLIETGSLKMLPDPVLLREMRAFVTKASPSGGIRYEADGGEHDDMVIALALAAKELPTDHGPRIQ